MPAGRKVSENCELLTGIWLAIGDDGSDFVNT